MLDPSSCRVKACIPDSPPTLSSDSCAPISEVKRGDQNCGAVAQTLLATGRAPDDLRLLRFCNEFRLQRDRSAPEARRAADRKQARLRRRVASPWPAATPAAGL